ncbi:MAG: tRNA (adenosine(37)-N6)-threonylcarbamoyltransferase complex ATPase subunit type 1 TsaE, partial [Acidobacteria bacterium]
GMARALGVDPREVQSPSYTLIHEHRGTAGRLVHVDLYRLEEAAEIEALGLEELFAGPGIKAVEWAERLASPPLGAVAVHLRRLAGGGREIRVVPCAP